LWDSGDLSRAKRLLDKNIIPVVHGPELAFFLGISPKLVGHMVVNPSKYYRSFQIKKKSGSRREIAAPRVFLKTVQRYILDCILAPVEVHAAATGFKRNTSIRDGANRHVGHRFVWNIDLKDFFPTIEKQTVRELFGEIGFQDQSDYFLAGLCCLNGRLPQGAPTSPAISNLILYEMDDLLFKLGQRNLLTYTRYADDLSFSGNNPIPKSFQTAVSRAIKAGGFKINSIETTSRNRSLFPHFGHVSFLRLVCSAIPVFISPVQRIDCPVARLGRAGRS
jgi:retron-type reverse transcriptase